MFEVECAADVVRVEGEASLVRKQEAVELCGRIEQRAVECGSRAGLLLNLDALARATPAAGMYAMGRLKALPLEQIALVGGNRFMRAFAKMVLTLGRFPRHRFFDDAETAQRWLAGS